MPNYHLSNLDQLEAEAIFVLRETAAQFENPARIKPQRSAVQTDYQRQI